MTDADLTIGQFARELGRKRARAVAQLMVMLEALPLDTLEQENAKSAGKDIVNNFADHLGALLPQLDPGGVPGDILEIVTEIRDIVRMPEPVAATATD